MPQCLQVVRTCLSVLLSRSPSNKMSVNEYARVGSNRPCRIPTRVRLVKSPPWLQAVAVQECPAQAAEVVATVIGGPEDSMRPSWSWSCLLYTSDAADEEDSV